MKLNNNELTQIKTSQIIANPKNVELDNVTSSEAIELLASSIANVGLLQAPIVYKDGRNYVLLSGHKRLQAVKSLYWDEVPCIVVPKPKTNEDEQSLLLYSNQYRSTPEELEKIIEIAKRSWATMDKDVKAKYRERYRKQFDKQFKNTLEYQNNPNEFIHNKFSPSCDYIRELTGLSVSNATVKRKITEIRDKELGIEKKEKEAAPKPKDKKEKAETCSIKNIINTMDNLTEMVNEYIETHDCDKVLGYWLETLVNDIEEAREYIVKAK